MNTYRFFFLFFFLMVWTNSSAQKSSKTIFEKYKLKRGGCSYNIKNIDFSPKNYGVAEKYPESYPNPLNNQLSTQSEIVEIFKGLKEDLQKNKAKFPEPIKKLKGGNQCFRKNGKWGLQSADGKELIKPRFDFIIADKNHDGFMGYQNEKCKYYNGKTGEVIVTESFYSIQYLAEKVYKIQSTKGYGLFSEGKVVLTPEHKFIQKRSWERVYFVIADNFILLEDLKTVLPDWGENEGIQFIDDYTIATSSNIYHTKKKKKLICGKDFNIEVLNIKNGLLSINKRGEASHFLIDIKGKILSKTPFIEIGSYSKEGLAPAAISAESGFRSPKEIYGLINRKGNWVLQPKYSYIYYKEGAFFGVDMNDPYLEEKIDAVTLKIIPPEKTSKSGQKYDKIEKINDYYSLGINGDKNKAISEVFETKSGRIIKKGLNYYRMEQISSPLGDGPFCEQTVYCAYIKSGEQFLDKNFKPLLPIHGRCFFHKNYFEGLSKEGRTLYDCQGKPVTVNINGEKFQNFKNIEIVNDEMTYVYFNDNTGYMVPKEGIAQPMNHNLQFIHPFGLNNYLTVRPYGPNGTGLVNAKGKTLIPIKLKRLSNFDQITGVALFTTYSKVAGLINQNGDIVKNQFFEEIDMLRFNLYSVKKGKKYGLINHKGEILIPINYDAIYRRDGLICAKFENQEVLFDINGEKIK